MIPPKVKIRLVESTCGGTGKYLRFEARFKTSDSVNSPRQHVVLSPLIHGDASADEREFHEKKFYEQLEEYLRSEHCGVLCH